MLTKEAEGMRLLCDHPGWAKGLRGVRVGTSTAFAAATAGGITVSAPIAHVDVYDPGLLSTAVPDALRALLVSRGPVARLRTPDLWDAVGTAIIRQVIRADQARKMYQRFAAAHGVPVTGAPPAFPRPEVVLALDEVEFTALGMAFKRRPLQAAAAEYLDRGEKWAQLPPLDLVAELQSVPRIGPWTAGAATADFSGDFSLYPYGDLAVRTHARRAVPELGLPGDEDEFATCWSRFTPTRAELSALTALTLSLGGDHDVPPKPGEP